jgi:hypothetical protein
MVSVAGAQPTVEHAHRVLEAVRLAEGDQRVTAGDGVGTGERIEGGNGKLRLRKRQPRLVAEPSMPTGRRRLEPPRLLVERQQQQRQRVRERHLRELGRERPGEKEVPPFESAFELAVCAPLRGHERMFACSSEWAGGRRASGGCRGTTRPAPAAALAAMNDPPDVAWPDPYPFA